MNKLIQWAEGKEKDVIHKRETKIKKERAKAYGNAGVITILNTILLNLILNAK